ncbi:MAG: hypothetical protein K2M11_10555, partial [Paramuribaculum sp.]|nr:hypothetical protein [Paramuribaculum sp.]
MSDNKSENKEKFGKTPVDPAEDVAAVMDNVPEAAEEDETAEDIENAEMNEIDALTKQHADHKLKDEKEKKEYLYL